MAGSARRALDRLPTKTALAVLSFVLGPPVENPHRVGKALRGELAGLHSVRVGSYRVVYEITEDQVIVLYIDHRADIYRPR